MKNKWAELDEMCSHCKGHATVICETRRIKLCQKCYDKIYDQEVEVEIR